MIASCESCGEYFLTEADPHVVRPTNHGYKLYCYCHIKGFDEVKSTTDMLEADNKKLREALENLRSNYCFGNTQVYIDIEEALKKVDGEQSSD